MPSKNATTTAARVFQILTTRTGDRRHFSTQQPLRTNLNPKPITEPQKMPVGDFLITSFVTGGAGIWVGKKISRALENTENGSETMEALTDSMIKLPSNS